MFCLIIWCIETMLSLWSYTIYIPYITKSCHGKHFVTFCSKFKLGLPRRHYAFLHGGKCLLDNFYNPLIHSYNVMSCRVDDIIVYATVVTKYSHMYTSSIKLLQWQQSFDDNIHLQSMNCFAQKPITLSYSILEGHRTNI